MWKTSKYILLTISLLITYNSCKEEKIGPKKGEVYLINNTNNYTTWMISKVTDTSVFYVPNDYKVSTSTEIKSINVLGSYTDLPKEINIKDFNSLHLTKTQ